MANNHQRTLKHVREQGGIAEIVERRLPIPGVKWGPRKDMFGFIDCFAELDGYILLIQIGAWSACGEKKKFICESKKVIARQLMMAGCKIQVWGWKKAPVSLRSKKWVVKIVDITFGDLS